MTRAAVVSFLYRLRPLTASMKRCAFFIEGRRLQDIAQQFGYRETSLRSMVCRFRAQVQAGEVPPFLCNRPWGDPSGSLTPQNQPSRRRQSSPMRAR